MLERKPIGADLSLEQLMKDGWEIGALVEEIKFMIEYQKKEEIDLETAELGRRILNLMNELQMPRNTMGYMYLKEAIIKVHNNPGLSEHLDTEVYPYIAGKYNTTVIRVEWEIARSIMEACDKGNQEALKKFFDDTINSVMAKKAFIEQAVTSLKNGLI